MKKKLSYSKSHYTNQQFKGGYYDVIDNFFTFSFTIFFVTKELHEV